MNLGMTLDGMTMDTATGMTVNLGAVPGTGHVKTDIRVTGEGLEQTTVTETYIVSEEGALAGYVSANGVWSRLETLTEDVASTALLAAPDAAATTLDESVTSWQGKPVICLHTSIAGQQLQALVGQALGELLAQLPQETAPDLSALGCEMTIYLDPDTRLPMGEQITITGMTDMLADLYAGLGIVVSVEEYTAAVTGRSYGEPMDVQLPAGAAENVARWERLAAGEPDNGDGTFTIYDTNAEGTTRFIMDVTLPTDGNYEVQTKGYDGVIVRREDYRELTYIVYYQGNDNGEGLVFQAGVESDANRWQQNGGKVERERMILETANYDFTCELVATQWSSLQEANLYAWTLLGRDEATDGSYYLYVTVRDGINDGLGLVKNADITADEFIAYLEAAVPSSLMG